MKSSRPFLKTLVKHRFWLVPLLLGVGTLIGALLIRSPWLQTLAPSPPISPTSSVSPSPTIAPFPSIVLTPSPSATVGKSPSPSPTGAAAKPGNTSGNTPSNTPKPSPSLTAQQQALNQQAKAEFQTSLASVDSLIEMHVAIAEGVPALSVTPSATATLLNEQGETLHPLTAGTSYDIQPNGTGMSMAGWQLPAIAWIEPSPDGLLQVGSRSYRGRLLIVNDAGRLWAVNYVNLRQYLYSVVGSEVSPSWSMAALKAQAVAARSYALTYYFKPISSLFHLGATEYYQVYKGIESEAPTIRQAVDTTAGEFVSYRGGIVESLYAASDDIVAEAFQGHGMSQLGALNLAEQGYSYDRILSNYYPQTGIGKIVQDTE